MSEAWVKLAGLCVLGLALIGCRTIPPDVKPPPEPEILTLPPQEARFANPGYPKQAFMDRDPIKKSGDIIPAQGSGNFGAPTIGGPSMGGYR